MKNLIAVLLLITSGHLFAQKACEYSENIKDSIGTYKLTKEHIFFENNFGGNSNYMFFALALTDGTPSVQISFIQKSKDFIKAKCFDKNSRLILQLNNGVVVSLLHDNSESCGTMVRDSNGFDNRILTANFLFIKGSIEELKKSPVNLLRIKYLTDLEDYVIKKEFTAELDSKVYQPSSYFINNLPCIDN